MSAAWSDKLSARQRAILESLSARLEALRSVEYLKDLPDSELRALIAKRSTVEVAFAEGQPVYQEGDIADALYILLEGSVRGLAVDRGCRSSTGDIGSSLPSPPSLPPLPPPPSLAAIDLAPSGRAVDSAVDSAASAGA